MARVHSFLPSLRKSVVSVKDALPSPASTSFLCRTDSYYPSHRTPIHGSKRSWYSVVMGETALLSTIWLSFLGLVNGLVRIVSRGAEL